MSITPRFSRHCRARSMAIGCLAAIGLTTLVWAQPARAQDPIFVDDSVNDGLVAHWKFDEPQTTIARAYVGPVNGTLEYTATMAFGPLPPVSFVDPGVLRLDGVIDATPQRVLIVDNAALNLVTDLSVTAWVQRELADIDTASTIYDSGTKTGAWFVGFLSDNRLTFTTDGVTDFPTNLVITDNGYHHIAFTVSGDELFAYLDGVPSAAVTVPFNMPIPSGDKLVGGKTSNNNAPFGGLIDDLRLYNRALSVVEVQRLATGKSCSTDGATWATAFRDLHCALAEATPGDDIWIGQGTYKPGTSPFVAYMLKNGVDLFGGFTGVTGAQETLLSQRPAFDASMPLTILSGDILGNDAATPFGAAGLYTDNTNTVVFASTGVSATVDGLRVQGGNARTGTGDGTLGGGLRALIGANIALTNVGFFGNQATGRGGAVFSRAPLQIVGAAFVSNRSVNSDGGAIFANDTLALKNVNVSNNQAAVNGGGLMVSTPFDSSVAVAVTIADSLFAANDALAGAGGGIRTDASAVITNTRFITNTAGTDGGALHTIAPLTITSSQFISNTASRDGGGVSSALVLAVPGQTQLTNNLFQRNRAARFGGAARLSGESTGDDYLDNVSGSEGGALIATGPMTITGALFLRNQSNLSGAIVSQGPRVIPPTQRLAVLNSLFAANGVSNSAGATDMRLFDLDLLLLHNTFADPVQLSPFATSSTVLFRSKAQVNNNIWANYPLGITADISSTVSEDFDFFANVPAPLSTSIPAGPNSITGDPLFIDPATDDYHIAPLSPARNSGTNVGIAEDFDGQLRPIGPGFDMGYDETTAVAPTAVAGGPYQGVEGSPVALNGSASSDNGPISSFAWDCTNDGTFESTVATPTGATCLYPDNGAFALRLRVTDGDGESATTTTTVAIANVNPVVTAPAPQSVQVGAPGNFALGSFVDPGPDAPWQVKVDWGDGSADTTLTLGGIGAIPPQSHTYAVAASRTVTVSVRDKDNDTSSQRFSVTVNPVMSPAQYLPLVEK